MSTLAFFPWLKLDEDIALPGFELVRFERGRRPGGDLQPALDSILELYVVGNNRPVSSATLLQLEGRHLTDALTEEEQSEAFLLAELVAFVGLSARRYFAPFRYANRDTFTFLTQSFTDPTSGVNVQTRRRDGGSVTLKSRAAARVRRPDHVAGISGAKLDSLLLEALLKARECDDWADFEEATFFFNRANTDSDQVFEPAEVVATTSAFERILGCKVGREDDLAERFVMEWRQRRCLLPSTCSRIPRDKTQYAKRTIAEIWIRDFFRHRGNVGHGRRRTAHPALWTAEEHLLLGAYAFPLLVKLILHRRGLYAGSWEDAVDVDVFEELASSQLFVQVPEEEVGGVETETEEERQLVWPWNVIRGRAHLKAIGESLAAPAEGD